MLSLMPPLIIRSFIDTVLPNGDRQKLNLLGVSMLFIPLAISVLRIFRTYFSSKVGHSLISDLRESLYVHLQRMSLRFYTNTKSGEIMSRLNNDVMGTQSAITGTFIDFITNIITLIISFSIMLTLDWKLSFISIGIFPLFIIPAHKVSKKIRKIWHESLEAQSFMNSIVQETLNVHGNLLMKLFNRSDENERRYRNTIHHVRDINIKRSIIGTSFFCFVGFVVSLGTALIYWIGGNFVLNNKLSIGTIIAITSYLNMIYGPISSIINSKIDFIQAMVSIERVFEVIDLPIEIKNCDDPIIIDESSFKGSIQVNNISFSYFKHNSDVAFGLEDQKRYTRGQFRSNDTSLSRIGKKYDLREINKDRWALRNVSFNVKEGEMCALVGRSGSGKTTLLNLMARLYDVNEGSITIDGYPLKELDIEQYMDFIGMVTQETYLFHDTLRRNLLYAKPNATDNEIIEACKAANIWKFIESLPEGLDTVIGERGFKLSGGEKQRVSIARVILKNPKILLLDEATSSLDSESESLIQDAVERLFKNRTCIVIAHRLSTILKADKIVVLDNSRVVEIGTHEELMEKKNIYYHLYQTQFMKEKKEE